MRVIDQDEHTLVPSSAMPIGLSTRILRILMVNRGCDTEAAFDSVTAAYCVDSYSQSLSVATTRSLLDSTQVPFAAIV